MKKEAPNKFFTILVVPDRTSRVRKITISRTRVFAAIGTLAALVLILSGVLVHYVRLLKQMQDYRSLYEENREVVTQIATDQKRIRDLDSRLDHLDQLEHKLRVMTSLEDPARNIAIGPLPDNEDGAPADALANGEDSAQDADAAISGTNSPEAAHNEFELRQMGFRLDKLDKQTQTREISLEELHALLDDQKSILGSTPSVWPTHGFVSSPFGYRISPFTSVKKMHEGLDIAAPHGTVVFAPADGVVTFTGLKGAYGNLVVVDHGYGLVTRYGHLSQILVQPGTHIKRGDKMALVGNTGRSTGDHLHYEVRIDGVPVNPTRYILD